MGKEIRDIYLAFDEHTYVRTAGAGRVSECDKTAYTGAMYRTVFGRGTRITAGKDAILLGEDEAAVIAPGVLYDFECREESFYIDFVCPRKLFDVAVKLTVVRDMSRLESLICAANGDDTGLRLAAEVAKIAALIMESERKPSSFDDVKRYMERYFYLPVDIGELAEFAGLSRGYFTAKFTAETGCSPYRFITGERLKNAKKLLEETDFPVSTVGLLCGYNSAVRFIDMFVRYEKITPQKYRLRAVQSDKRRG